MKDFAILRKLIIENDTEIEEGDGVRIVTEDGSTFKGEVTLVLDNELEIELSGNIDGDLSVRYEDIKEIQLI